MSKHYKCDRKACRAEIPIYEHEQFPGYDGKRYDVCRKTECREAFAAMKIEMQRAIGSHAEASKRIAAELEARFLNGETSGAKT